MAFLMRKRSVVQMSALMTMFVKEKKGDEHPDGWNMNKWKHADELLEYLTDETNRYAHDFFLK